MNKSKLDTRARGYKKHRHDTHYRYPCPLACMWCVCVEKLVKCGYARGRVSAGLFVRISEYVGDVVLFGIDYVE